MDSYHYVSEKNNILFTLEYLDSFKKTLNDFYEDNLYFETNKLKFIEDINNMLTHIYDKNILQHYSENLINLIKSSSYNNDLENFKNVMNKIELHSRIISSDLNIEIQITRDDMVYKHMSKINNLKKTSQDLLKNMSLLLSFYDKIYVKYIKLQFYSHYKITKININNIDLFINNINIIQKQMLDLKTNIENFYYYNGRKQNTIETWKIVKDDFFKISYRPDMFKKIVLDEKEVAFFN